MPSGMDTVEFLRKVRDREAPATREIADFVQSVAAGTLPDYQAAAFLMAVRIQGLAPAPTVDLTLAMRDSGVTVDLRDLGSAVVDKHSTGGVGDKISIPLAPLAAACGVFVPMIGGRGLGHSGGTLDKLESIPGFRVDLDLQQFERQVRTLGVSMIGQTDALAPADRILYSLRDVTAAIESIPLITASILSKKLAEGISGLVLDVKTGRGAFMKTEDEARALAQSLARVGTDAGVRVQALLTRMDTPLGTTIGNALEVRESIAILRGEGPADTTALTCELATHMVALAHTVDLDTARTRVGRALASGAALEKFRALVEAQSGDPRVVDEVWRLPHAPATSVINADATGFVTALDAYGLGRFAMQLGAGRHQVHDRVDPGVGVEVLTKLGDAVQAGDPLLRVHHRDTFDPSLAQRAITIADAEPDVPPLIYDVLAGP